MESLAFVMSFRKAIVSFGQPSFMALLSASSLACNAPHRLSCRI
jgi:hypothetical protein